MAAMRPNWGPASSSREREQPLAQQQRVRLAGQPGSAPTNMKPSSLVLNASSRKPASPNQETYTSGMADPITFRPTAEDTGNLTILTADGTSPTHAIRHALELAAHSKRQEDLRADIPRFLDGLRARLGPGAAVTVLDNRYVPGSSSPISRTSPEGDTFQRRTLSDGSEYEILKNFPDRGQFIADVAAVGTDVEWTSLRYFWVATFRLA